MSGFDDWTGAHPPEWYEARFKESVQAMEEIDKETKAWYRLSLYRRLLPAQMGGLAVYVRLDRVIESADNLAEELTRCRSRGPAATAALQDVRHYAQLLLDLLSDHTLQLLDEPCLEALRALAVSIAETTTVKVSRSSISQAHEDLESATDAVSDYAFSLARRVFGTFGVFWLDEFLMLDKAGESLVDSLAVPDEFIRELQGVPDNESVAGKDPFVPRWFQLNILAALNDCALKKDQLAEAVCGGKENARRLYHPHGLKELRKEGLVKHEEGVGFYRPDRPPPEAITDPD